MSFQIKFVLVDLQHNSLITKLQMSSDWYSNSVTLLMIPAHCIINTSMLCLYDHNLLNSLWQIRHQVYKWNITVPSVTKKGIFVRVKIGVNILIMLPQCCIALMYDALSEEICMMNDLHLSHVGNAIMYLWSKKMLIANQCSKQFQVFIKHIGNVNVKCTIWGLYIKSDARS